MEKTPNLTRKTHMENPPHGTPWIRSASFSVLLTEAPWSQNTCHSTCSAWASSKWAGGAPV
jgi:hypothetical protein